MKKNKYGSVIPTTCKTNEQWREERSHSIGASEVPVLFGENYFTTPYELAVKKKNELKGIFDYTENESMQDGHLLEAPVAQKFSIKTGHQIIQASSAEYLLRRSEIQFMHASPDRTYWIDENGKRNDANKGIVECKTTRRPIDKDNLPISWIFQLQVQLGISGYKEGHLAWWNLAIRDGFDYKRFEFDPELFDAAVVVCRYFWEHCVLGDEIPDPVAARDIVNIYPASTEGKTITANDEIRDIITEIKECQAAQKELGGQIDGLKEKLILHFTDEEAIVDPETGKPLATYKTKKGATKVDSKKLKAEYADIFAKCSKKENDSRILLIK